MQLEVLEFDIVGELESIVDMFSVQGLANSTEVAMDLADDMERTVKGDPSRVRQVAVVFGRRSRRYALSVVLPPSGQFSSWHVYCRYLPTS